MFLHLITCRTAAERGLKRYFTGRHCPAGACSEREVATRRCLCTGCRARSASWKRRNPEKHAESRRKWLADNRERLKEKRRKFVTENRDEVRRYWSDYYEKNREREKAKSRRNYYADRVSANERVTRRRLAARQRVPKWFGEYDAFVFKEASNLCIARFSATGVVHHVDHMIPLQCREASGLHCGINFQVIPDFLNRRKGNRLWLHLPDQWLSALHNQ